MSNLTDALIAAKLIGAEGGGSGGGSGLPEITTTTTTIFAEKSVAFEEDSGLYYGELTDATLSIGASYTVTWDGVKYSCVAVDRGSDGVILGNLSLWEMGEDTGEPFLIDYLNNRTDAVTADSTATHTVKITTVVQTPADGTVLVVAGGEWTLQEGYGYEKEGTVTLIADKYLPKLITAQGTPAASVTIAANATEEVLVSNSVTETRKRYQIMAMTVGTGGSSYYLQPIGIGRAVPGALVINAYNTTGASKTLSTSTVIGLLLQELSF